MVYPGRQRYYCNECGGLLWTATGTCMDCGLPAERQGIHPATAGENEMLRGSATYGTRDLPTSRLRSVIHHTFRWCMPPSS